MSQLINSKYDSIQIHLRSDDPDLDTDDTESSVKFTFQRVITIPPQTKALLSVLNCQIPNTFYNITANMRMTMFIELAVPVNPGDFPNINPTTIDIRKGKYTACSFAKRIQEQTFTALPADVPVAPAEYPDWNCAISDDESRGKWRVINTNGNAWRISNLLIEVDGVFVPSPLRNQNYIEIVRFFGCVNGPISTGGGMSPFVFNSYVGNYQNLITEQPFAWGVDASTYYSPEIPDFTGHHNLYIGTQLITNSVDSLVGGLENVIAKIPVSAPFGNMIQYNGESRGGTLLEDQFLSEIQLDIQDHNNNIIDLNGVRWNITLLLEFIDIKEIEQINAQHKSSELIRATVPLAQQRKARAANRNREMAIKHRIKRYFDSLTTKKQVKSEIMDHSIGKVPILQGLTGVVSGGNPPKDLAPIKTVQGVDIPMAHPLP